MAQLHPPRHGYVLVGRRGCFHRAPRVYEPPPRREGAALRQHRGKRKDRRRADRRTDLCGHLGAHLPRRPGARRGSRRRSRERIARRQRRGRRAVYGRVRRRGVYGVLAGRGAGCRFALSAGEVRLPPRGRDGARLPPLTPGGSGFPRLPRDDRARVQRRRISRRIPHRAERRDLHPRHALRQGRAWPQHRDLRHVRLRYRLQREQHRHDPRCAWRSRRRTGALPPSDQRSCNALERVRLSQSRRSFRQGKGAWRALLPDVRRRAAGGYRLPEAGRAAYGLSVPRLNARARAVG